MMLCSACMTRHFNGIRRPEPVKWTWRSFGGGHDQRYAFPVGARKVFSALHAEARQALDRERLARQNPLSVCRCADRRSPCRAPFSSDVRQREQQRPVVLA